MLYIWDEYINKWTDIVCEYPLFNLILWVFRGREVNPLTDGGSGCLDRACKSWVALKYYSSIIMPTEITYTHSHCETRHCWQV